MNSSDTSSCGFLQNQVYTKPHNPAPPPQVLLWFFMLEDADLKRKKREYLEKAENRTVGKEVGIANLLQCEASQLVF